jgi:multidrug efflux system outer membrane protein
LEAGYTNELDFQRSESQLQQTQAEMLAVERQRLQLDHRLATLLGKTPADFSLAPLTHEGELAAPPPPPSVPAGLPSQLLERRPDIIAAQQQMAEANARIGVARNAFFPQLNLTASGGFESTELGDLFQWSSRTWVLGPLVGTAVSLPIFEGGRNISRLDFAKAGFDGAVATYRQQVLTAFREVEDDLASLRLLADQAEAQQAAMTASARVVKLSTLRYDEGLVSQLEVIDSQRSLLSAQRALANVEGQRYATTVHLIRALGGGWEQKAAGE